MKKLKIPATLWIGTAALALLGSVPDLLMAFTSQQTYVLTMEVTVGGTPIPSQGFQIRHNELRGFSHVSKLMIFKGSVGTNLNGVGSAGTGVSNESEGSKIHLIIRYQLLKNPPAAPEPPVTIEETFESSRAQFSYQIPQSDIDDDVFSFKYQILAEELDKNGERIHTFAVPPGAFSDETQWAGPGEIVNAPEPIEPSGGMVVLFDANPNDGDSVVVVPPRVVDSPTRITLSEVSLADPFPGTPSQPYAMYHLEADRPLKGNVHVSVIYPEFAPTTVPGSGWPVGGTPVPTGSLSLAIWDGFNWRNIGGKLDPLNKTLTARSGSFKYLGVFAMGPPSAQSIAPTEKIITPNGDNQNDVANFSGLSGSTQVEIFDMTGHRVRSYIPGANGFWDGRDDSGKIVESGVYIYQFKEGGERMSGVIAVAK